MKVLTIGRTYPDKRTGMMGVFEFEQAQALSKYGCKVIYAFCDTRSIKSLRRYGSYYKENNNINVYGYHLPIGGLPQKIFSIIKRQYFKKVLSKILTNEGTPDIIHIHFPLLNLTDEIWDLLKEINRPIVVTEHWSKVQTKELEPFRINLLKRIVEEADEFISVGELLRKSVVELTDTKKEVKVIPNMVSPLFYYDSSEKENRNTYEFVAVGRLVNLKKFDVVIEAFTKAFKHNKNVNLTIIGGGPLYNKLNRQIEELDMISRIYMTGFLTRNETAKKVRQSDVFVSGSVLETFGVPFIEAMASGKPVIGVKGGSIDIYINDSNGILYDANNVDHLASTLHSLYQNRNKYNEEQIADKARNLFSEQAIVERLKGTYKNLLD